MHEHKKPQLQLSIRDDGMDLHTNGEAGPLAAHVLRALAKPMGAPDVIVVQASAPEPQQDEEALVNAIRHIGKEAPDSKTGARDILAHLRAQGLMRTPGDVDISQLEAMKAARDGAVRALRETEHERDTARAQVRALTTKAEEANRQRDVEYMRAEAEGRKAIEASEREATAKAALQRCQADLFREQRALAMEREALKAAQRRIEALESQPAQGSELQAHETHRG